MSKGTLSKIDSLKKIGEVAFNCSGDDETFQAFMSLAIELAKEDKYIAYLIYKRYLGIRVIFDYVLWNHPTIEKFLKLVGYIEATTYCV